MTFRLIPMLFAAAISLFAGILISGIYLTVQIGGSFEALKNMNPLILLDYLPNRGRLQQPVFQNSYMLVGGVFVVGMCIAAVIVLSGKLTTYGDAHFQDRRELKKNRMLAEFGAGLLFGRFITPPNMSGNRELKVTGKPSYLKRFFPNYYYDNFSPFVSSHYDTFPNAMMVAPTGAGKTVSYVVPTCLTFPGSMVVLDVKGEIFEKTSRHRKATGDDVFRFAPLDFKHPSHQYNPIHRISQFENPDQQYTEMDKLSGYFLQVEGGNAASFLNGGRQLFVAAGMLAIQRENPTMGEVYRILYGDGSEEDRSKTPEDRLTELAEEVRHTQASATFAKFAGYEDRIRTSYFSVLEGAGLAGWTNPRVEKVTRKNEIDFSTIRTNSQSVYLCVNSDDIPIISSLIRLFFTELVAYLRGAGPLSEAEPHPVLIMLDEFDQLGHMPIFVKAIKETRGNGGRISIVTQSIPGLSTIYNEHEQQSLAANCGMKIYITANERTTAEAIETDLGLRTGLSTGYSVDRAGLSFGRGNISHNAEQRPLMTASQIRKLDASRVILIPEKQHPILAERIEYYRDPALQPIYDAQEQYELPYPKLDQDVISTLEDKLSEQDKENVATLTRLAELEEETRIQKKELKQYRSDELTEAQNETPTVTDEFETEEESTNLDDWEYEPPAMADHEYLLTKEEAKHHDLCYRSAHKVERLQDGQIYIAIAAIRDPDKPAYCLFSDAQDETLCRVIHPSEGVYQLDELGLDISELQVGQEISL